MTDSTQSAMDKIKELEKDSKSTWADIEGWDEDHEFLLRAFKVMREMAAEYSTEAHGGYPSYSDIDRAFEEEMKRSS